MRSLSHSLWPSLTLGLLLTLLFAGCNNQTEKSDGLISFYVDDSTFVTLPTSGVLKGKDITIYNGGEDIVLSLVDENTFSVPVFNGSLVGGWREDGAFCGGWTDSLRSPDYFIPLEIVPSINGEECNETPSEFNYKTTCGLLVAQEFCDSVVGTILTPTGDYRYLSGFINAGVLQLGAFDGAHLFSFEADVVGDSLINGWFKSGTHFSKPWSGVKTNKVAPNWSSSQEPNLDKPVSFRALSLDGVEVEVSLNSLEDSGKKLLVVDVLGTWCPNCYDEVRLLKEMSNKHPEVMFVSVAFERLDTVKALERLTQFKADLGLDWEVYYGGTASKALADSVLPFLGGVKSFPTTAFIPLEGQIKVHTGFSGPATNEYDKEVDFYTSTIESFLDAPLDASNE